MTAYESLSAQPEMANATDIFKRLYIAASSALGQGYDGISLITSETHLYIEASLMPGREQPFVIEAYDISSCSLEQATRFEIRPDEIRPDSLANRDKFIVLRADLETEKWWPIEMLEWCLSHLNDSEYEFRAQWTDYAHIA